MYICVYILHNNIDIKNSNETTNLGVKSSIFYVTYFFSITQQWIYIV